MLVNKSLKKLHEDIKINSNNSAIIKVNISWKSATEWFHENVMKISSFIWNI
jgi:hypothetical protein